MCTIFEAQLNSLAEPVEIVPYSPEWPGRFHALGVALRGALGDVALRIDHIGSTAVPGLAAKPILDVQVSVAARKIELADRHRHDRQACTEAKGEVVREILGRADRWSQATGWLPAPPDA